MGSIEKDAGKERRGAQRVYASFVEYCRVEDVFKKKFQAFTENISATGVCIFVNEEIDEKTLLSVTIYLLDGSAPIDAKGRVAWIRPSVFLHIKDEKHFDVGIEFVDLSQENRDRLIHYAAKYAREVPPPKK
jgi:hypothetical protein